MPTGLDCWCRFAKHQQQRKWVVSQFKISISYPNILGKMGNQRFSPMV